MLEICRLLGTKKINTTSYHLQTDRLVERLKCTQITMLSKYVQKCGRDWDECLLYVLFAYRVSVHDSTKESPFNLMYRRDAKWPTETSLSQPTIPYQVDFQAELVTHPMHGL